MTGALGLLLLLGVGAGLALTGLPAFLVVFAASIIGAGLAIVAGVADAGVFSALPLRLVNLLDNDLFQAIPLYVLMGALLNRLPVTDALFRTIVSIAPRSRAAPLVAGLGLGALLGPMNGSVGASVLALSRSLAPRLQENAVPPATRHAFVAVSSTLGVVIPPSLVLILLGDAMLSAHTIAVNTMGRADRIINTQDVFRGALAPAGLFLALCIVISIFSARNLPERTDGIAHKRPSIGEIAVSLTTIGLLVGLLAAVAAGYLYVVEAAALGALTLFVAGLVTGRFANGQLAVLLSEVMAGAGALFALLVAATTLTLVLRVLGTDKFVAAWLAAVPGSETAVTLLVLAAIGAAAFVLDAFEIIFVVIPIVAPPLLMRAPDAVWVAVLILLCLQTSFLLPPFGYALMVVQGVLRDNTPARMVWRALSPFLIAQLLVLGAVVTFPQLVHLRDPAPTAQTAPVLLPDADVSKKFEDLVPQFDDAPPLNFDK